MMRVVDPFPAGGEFVGMANYGSGSSHNFLVEESEPLPNSTSDEGSHHH